MGLYLCVFDNDEELDGVEVGSYADWGSFIDAVATTEDGGRGSRYPLLTLHSDCDGAWSPDEAKVLVENLRELASAFEKLPPVPPLPGSWQSRVAKENGLKFATLYDCFIDVDGEALLDRLSRLASLAHQRGQSVLFQ